MACITIPVSHLDPPAMQARKEKLLTLSQLPASYALADVDPAATELPAPLLWRARVVSMDDIELYRFNPFVAETQHAVPFVSYWNELKAIRTIFTQMQEKEVKETPQYTTLSGLWLQHNLRLTEETTEHNRHEPCTVLDLADPANQAYRSILESLETRGHSVGVVPAVFPETTGRGLVFQRDVVYPEPVVRVPRELLFNVETISTNTAFHTIFESLALDNDTRLLLFLIHEKFGAAPTRQWQAFITTLPEKYDTLFFWTEQELAVLAGSRLLAECTEQRSHLKQFYDDLHPKLCSAHPDVFGGDVFTFENMLWARAVFDSRAFIIKIGDKEMTTLVPYAEYINHSCHSGHVSFRRFDEESGCLVLESLGKGVAGTQAFMNYGPMQNSDLLLGYGFAVEDNQLETCVLDVDIQDEEDPLYAEKSRILTSLDLPKDHLLDRSNPTNHYLMAALRVAVAESPEELAYFAEGFRAMQGSPSAEYESKARGALGMLPRKDVGVYYLLVGEADVWLGSLRRILPNVCVFDN